MVAGLDETDVAGSRGPAPASEPIIDTLFDIVNDLESQYEPCFLICSAITGVYSHGDTTIHRSVVTLKQ
jgi:hypothetical protein